MREWLRLGEARELLGVTDYTWRQLLGAGVIVRRRLPGTRQWRYWRAELEAVKRRLRAAA